MEDGEDKPKGFVVNDRRVSASEPTDGGDQDSKVVEPASAPRATDSMPPSNVPPIDFNTFVLSLSTSALMHLGLGLDGQESGSVNLDLARQTIDLLSLLEEKTAGNLTGEEEHLLAQVLFDLRMRFVAASKK